MSVPTHSSQALTDVEDSVLVVVNVQRSFLDKLAPDDEGPLVARIS